jgi:uncharacterized heparinase superfamily protein
LGLRILNLLLLLRTLRHLHWKQLVYRPLRVAQFRIYKNVPQLASRWHDLQEPAPQPAAEIVGAIRGVFENSFDHLKPPLEQFDQRLCDLIEGRFSFLNRTLKLNPIDWNRRYESHLWNYHLHYFGYAIWCARDFVERGNERSMQTCRELIRSWSEQARIGRSDGWDIYPTSLRIVNWIYAYSLVADHCDDRVFLERWRTSIYRQLDFLNHHLEFHLLANHLLKNVKALVIGGLLFNQEKWLGKGQRLLWREVEEQVLEDGGHYERAPMYHAQVLADLLECYALLKTANHASQPAAVDSKLRAMARFLEAMSYPDDTLALFNDSANTEETRPRPIIETSEKIVGYDETPLTPAFPQTGYYLWVSPDEKEKMIVDAGPPSVDYNTAHAHCDLLSYELWLDGKPFIVDSGLHGYGGDHFREYCRSTRAHNTVMFDGREQSEIWSTFRMARRAELLGVEVNSTHQSWNFWAEYCPYYDPKLRHERHIRRDRGGGWHIEDRLVSGLADRATSFIHLHPGVRARKVDDHEFGVECCAGQTKVVIEAFAAERMKIIEGLESPVQGWYFPDFGIAQPSQTICLEYQMQNDRPFGYKITYSTQASASAGSEFS